MFLKYFHRFCNFDQHSFSKHNSSKIVDRNFEEHFRISCTNCHISQCCPIPDACHLPVKHNQLPSATVLLSYQLRIYHGMMMICLPSSNRGCCSDFSTFFKPIIRSISPVFVFNRGTIAPPSSLSGDYITMVLY